MYCSKCGTKADGDFCWKCGSKLYKPTDNEENNFESDSNISNQSSYDEDAEIVSVVEHDESEGERVWTRDTILVMGKVVVFILIIVLIAFLILSFKLSFKTDSNDGKCDICGKPASSYSPDGNEYCSKHLEDAINHYLH